jgi:ankyrin repeat protein
MDALYHAIANGHAAAVNMLLRALKAEPTWADTQTAILKSYPEVLSVLLSCKPDLIKLKQDDKTLLHIAAESANPEIVQILIDRGAEVNLPFASTQHPLHRAAASISSHSLDPQKAWEVVRILLKNGADPNLTDNHGENPLWQLARVSLVDRQIAVKEIALLLIKHGVDIHHVDHSGNKIQHVAARCLNLALLKVLAHFGANMEEPNISGETCLGLALDAERRHMLWLRGRKEEECINWLSGK